MTSARPAAAHLAEIAPGVLNRTAWLDSKIIVDGVQIAPISVITEVLRAADSIGLIRNSPNQPRPEATHIDAACALLASYHARYSLDPRKVLESLPHAFTQARVNAQGQRELDRVDAAHELLQRHLKEVNGASTS